MKITYLSASARSVSAALWGKTQNDREQETERKTDLNFLFSVMKKTPLFQRCVCVQSRDQIMDQ